MHSFIPLALLSAAAYSLSNLLQKHLVGRVDEYAVAWSRYLFASPFLLLFLWRDGVPRIDPRFWPVIAALVTAEIGVAVIWAKALKRASVTKTIPFLAFLPLFVAVGGFLLLGEALTLVQLLAMLAIVAGCYVLNVEKGSARQVLAPLRLVWREKGGLYILFLCAVWGLLMPLGKLATLYSSPTFFTAVFFSLTAVVFWPVFHVKSRHGVAGIKRNSLLFGLTGFFTSVFMVTLFMAAKSGPVALVSAVSSTNIFITVLLAGTLLREKYLAQRLIATTIMTLGAVLLTLS